MCIVRWYTIQRGCVAWTVPVHYISLWLTRVDQSERRLRGEPPTVGPGVGGASLRLSDSIHTPCVVYRSKLRNKVGFKLKEPCCPFHNQSSKPGVLSSQFASLSACQLVACQLVSLSACQLVSLHRPHHPGGAVDLLHRLLLRAGSPSLGGSCIQDLLLGLLLLHHWLLGHWLLHHWLLLLLLLLLHLHHLQHYITFSQADTRPHELYELTV